MRERKQRPKSGHGPMKRFALFIVPDKPEGDEAGEDEERGKLLSDM